MAERPFVSIVVPARDEGATIERCLRSLLDQDYPPDAFEVVAVIGNGKSETHEIAERLAAGDPRLNVVANPEGRTPVALNLGLDAARGDLIGRLDGHAWADRDWLSAAVDAMQRTGADGVGGVALHIGVGATGRAVAIAMSSPLGSGNASFRVGGGEGESDTIIFPLYKRAVFERVGRYDEALTRNQDDEMNHRIRLAGMRLWFDPAVRATYQVRSSLQSLWRQYADYGRFRVATIAKHGRPGAPRQLAPAALVAGLAGAATLEIASRGTLPVGRLAAGGYLATLAVGGAVEAARAGRPELAPRVTAALGAMHLGSGSGFWRAVAERARA